MPGLLTDLAALPAARRREVETRLRDDTVAWLTTVRASGRPDTVPIWFLWDGARILFYSRPDALKLRNLAGNPHVSLVLDDTRGGEDVVRMEATARHEPDHPGADRVEAFVRKYDELIRSIGYDTPEAYAQTWSAAVLVRPTRLHA